MNSADPPEEKRSKFKPFAMTHNILLCLLYTKYLNFAIFAPLMQSSEQQKLLFTLKTKNIEYSY